jgi:hypothetical protein
MCKKSAPAQSIWATHSLNYTNERPATCQLITGRKPGFRPRLASPVGTVGETGILRHRE